MSKKIQLTIAEPCHENWDGMTPVEKGKFCGSCQKQVVDFSNMSDRQVAEFFKKPILSLSKGGSVCGRFMNDQLDREITIPRKRIPWVKYFFQIALPAFLMSMKVSAQKKQGKIKVVTTDTVQRPPNPDYRTMGMIALPIDKKPVSVDTVVVPVKQPLQTVKGEIAINTQAKQPVCSDEIMGTIAIDWQPAKTDKNEIKGRVVDEKGEPVAFASIETSKPGQGVIADENGFFTIKKSWLKNDKELLVSSSGFESRRIIAADEKNIEGELYIQLKSNAVLQEVVVIAYTGTIKGKVTMGSVTKIKSEELMISKKDSAIGEKQIKLFAETNTSITIFPNPIQSGGTLNLKIMKMDEGYYQFQILNQSGQMVQQKEVWVDAEARLLNMDVPVVAAGSYFMGLTNKKTGKKLTEKIIIQ